MMKIKLVIINRAVPGSGKTTALKTIKETLRQKGLSVQDDIKVHSTDEFFMCGEKYDFDITKLNEYHKQNLKDFESSLKANKQVVICDNTNLLPWQCEPYTKLAREYGYKIVFLNIKPKSLEEHLKTQEVTPQNPSAHGVPKDILERNIDEFGIYNDLFDKTMPKNPIRHRHYEWDIENNCRKDIGEADYFDTDYIISLPSWWDKNTIIEHLNEIIDSNFKVFNYIFHTCGDERMPLVWGIKGIKAHKHATHILIYSKGYEHIKDIAKKFAPKCKIDSIEIEPFDISDITNKLTKYIESKKLNNIALNLTGGTKIMLLAGLNVAKRFNLKTYYIDTQARLISLDNFTSEQIAPISHVSEFLRATTFELESIKNINNNYIQERKTLNELLFHHKNLLITLYSQLSKLIQEDKKTFEMSAPDFEMSNKFLHISYKSKQGILRINEKFEISGHNKALRYIKGGWFEEYIYLQLLPLMQKKGYIYDLQINTSLRIKKETHLYQEFDILFTDGYRIFIIECKSGNIKTTDIEKLANIKQRYGNLSATCILASTYTPKLPNVKKKIKENKLVLITKDYQNEIKNIILNQ